MFERAEDVNKLTREFFMYRNGNVVHTTKNVKNKVCNWNPDFLGVINGILYVGEEKSSSELRGEKRNEHHICFAYERNSTEIYSDLKKINEICIWFKKVKCPHDPPCSHYGQYWRESSQIRSVMSEFLEKNKGNIGTLNNEEFYLVRFLLGIVLAQLAEYFYIFMHVEELKRRIGNGRCTGLEGIRPEIMKAHQNKLVKGMLVIPAEFKKELGTTIELLRSASFDKFIKSKLSDNIFESVKAPVEFRGILATEIAYKIF